MPLAEGQKIWVLVPLAFLLAGCGPSVHDGEHPPSEAEALQVIEDFCEQPVVPCRNEDCVPEVEPCLTQQGCIDEVLFFYDEESPRCQHLRLEFMRCQTGMTCEEEEEDRTGQSHACDPERNAISAECPCCI